MGSLITCLRSYSVAKQSILVPSYLLLLKNTFIEIEEYEFHQYKSPISINNIDINKIVVSNKFLFGKQDFKYFIGYKDNKDIRPLHIFFPEMSIFKRYSDKTKCMYFMIKDGKIIDKCMIKFCI